jgi:hypothetical protein
MNFPRGFNPQYSTLVTPKLRRTGGYTFVEHGYSNDDVTESESLDDLLVTQLHRILPLGDGMPRLEKIRDAIDFMLREEGKRKLGLTA